ncbi:histidine kinase [Rhodomicrobium udaipurense]|uniref:Histidine kinase n=1 Tax=Rhodomicrobium udaipurense TaxID=1202716 RepID=A0A8I1GC59_9HYPH|nr:histidine kinase [Rhodomicrobium udaipurense]MBJ7542254.1 histidine kinase [Rhodomicrobium udaipurense]
MSLSIPELKTVAMLLLRIRTFAEDAVNVAESGGDIAVTARIKTLLFRAQDVEREIEARLAAAEKAERQS